jgi:hypothetical protein
MPRFWKIVFGIWIGTWTTCWGLLMFAATVEQPTAFKALETWWTWIEGILGQNAEWYFSGFCLLMLFVPVFLWVVWFRQMKKPHDGKIPDAIKPQPDKPRPPSTMISIADGAKITDGEIVGNIAMNCDSLLSMESGAEMHRTKIERNTLVRDGVEGAIPTAEKRDPRAPLPGEVDLRKFPKAAVIFHDCTDVKAKNIEVGSKWDAAVVVSKSSGVDIQDARGKDGKEENPKT